MNAISTEGRWNNALAAPLDDKLGAEVPDNEYEDNRPLYRCAACLADGERSLHKYVDDCPFYD